MISIEQQQKLLLSISRELKGQITAYAIGGTAMMFLGLKDATLDIDLVFDDVESKSLFKSAAEKLGYSEMDAFKVYGAKNDKPDMLTRGDERFDLFVVNVIDFIFSDAMKMRAADMHQFGDNLLLKIADPHDLILMKCATDRLKDLDDARKIIERMPIDWKIMIKEAKTQVSLGKDHALFDLGEFLEKLKKDMGQEIPDAVLDELWGLVQKQAKEKQRKL